MNSIGAAKEQAGCACVSSALIIGFYCAILVVIHLYNHHKASKAQEPLNSSKNTNHKIIRQFFIGSIIYAMISGIALVSPRIGGYISVLPFVSGAVLVNTMLNKSMLQTEIQVAGNVWGAVITTGFFLVSWTFL
ncbi:MAG: hypothetical protein K6C40_14590, partial [Thermoguttaceae bacterium]|nr:hypothetical protein [Thermoguttaceae bacterium]